MGEYLEAEPAARQRLGGIGKTKFYELLAAGELRSVRLGRRRLVVGGSIDEYIGRLQDQQVDVPTTVRAS